MGDDSRESCGLVSALVLDGKGGARELDWDGLRAHQPEAGPLWMHLDHAESDSRTYLRDDSGLEPLVQNALLERQPRPRVVFHDGDCMMVIIRGVNRNEGADPEDMVSLRIWLEPQRVISLRHRRVVATQQVRQALHEGTGPRRVGELLLAMVQRVRLVDQP